ncbi:MAG: trypsin-like peptidase domain-containing protein [Pseudomonadota bacterium]
MIRRNSLLINACLLVCSLFTPLYADGISSAEKVYTKVNNAVFMVFDVKDNNIKHPVDYGSSVAVAKDIVATNCHVALQGDARLIKVGDKLLPATLIYKDELNDICLLQIAEKTLTPVAFRAASKVRIGEEVYAIGSPRGYEKSISRGIISNKIKFKESFILQTDAATSPGSSGGGLFDTHSRLIGITFAKNEAVGSEGIGFAIPAEMIESVVKKLELS